MNPKLETENPEELWKDGIWVSSDNRVKIPTLQEVYDFISENPKYSKTGFWCCMVDNYDYMHAVLCANCHVMFCIYPHINLFKNRERNACCSQNCNLELLS